MIVWALIDDRVGGNNQAKALAEVISKNYITKKIVYSSLIALPNFIRRSSLLGVDRGKSDSLTGELPDVVICAGRRSSSVALNIKKRSGGKTFAICIMNPNISFSRFDAVILPKHDNTLNAPKNVIESNGSIGLVNSEKMAAEAKKWSDFFRSNNRPFVSLIIGGDTKDYKFDPQKFGKMAFQLSNIVNKLNGTLLITTSRRTSDECIVEIRRNMNCDYFLYDWKLENDENNKNKNPLGNPYFAFLGLSDFLVVTGDSMSMVSEAASTGKPTYVYMPRESLSKKHQRFLENMIGTGYIKEFSGEIKKLEKYSYKPLNEAKRVGDIVLRMIGKKR